MSMKVFDTKKTADLFVDILEKLPTPATRMALTEKVKDLYWTKALSEGEQYAEYQVTTQELRELAKPLI